MTDLVTFYLRDGHSFVAETEPAEPHYDGDLAGPSGSWSHAAEGSEPVSRRARRSDIGREFDACLGHVRHVAEVAFEVLREAANPDEVKLTLGVKLTQEAGAVIARTALEGNVAVELLWKRAASIDEKP